MKSVINPISLAQLTMGPAGWAALATRTLFSAIGQQVIQNLGQQLGLPQSVIDVAHSAFSGSFGGGALAGGTIGQAVQSLAQQFNLPATDAGNLERNANDAARQMTDSVLQNIRENGSGDDYAAAVKGKSRLVALAMAMGAVMDDKMDRMIELGEKLDGAKKTGSLSAEMQGLGQEMNMVSNALASTIKSIGESATTLARKG
ncbi:hypothetical protein PK98_00175 [Croceibacterium mercuriale]|uniref:Uncharacterized protein n=1 Tax=Croceibacterium mercuriale TaxID=1572751 RepID=A0A0B2BV03_9SPHN|nr:hypothetical protein [Croceibacterium mercuriale]KHL25229.1 hypothetical protein PK98_00175 [Croceibacterium mercuriale]